MLMIKSGDNDATDTMLKIKSGDNDATDALLEIKKTQTGRIAEAIAACKTLEELKKAVEDSVVEKYTGILGDECPKCGKRNVVSREISTRSSDEGGYTIRYCLQCKITF